MDTGGLAQMTYNRPFPSNLPASSGYASRDRGAQLKRLSMDGLDDRSAAAGSPAPRTSRGHLLAGLRTQPKTPGSAPASQSEFGLENSRFAASPRDRNPPLSATSPNASFGFGQQYGGYQLYSMPEQVLAPPKIQINGDGNDEQVDPKLYAELVAKNMYLAQQQRRLQEQLLNVQAAAAAQQMQNLQLSQGHASPPLNMYAQQPIISAVAGSQPGLYSVYNPSTGQTSLFMDANVQQQQQQQQQLQMQMQLQQQQQAYASPIQTDSRFAGQAASPTSFSPVSSRALSPPGLSNPSGQGLASNSSALAFRRGHKKVSSLSSSLSHVPEHVEPGPKTSIPRTAGFPATPMTGTFAPGHNRSGEHPSRQPRGPPQLDELKAKPTSKHEGSKNFATRQRRHAVHSLVRAGMERRTARGSTGSGSMTPLSESENPTGSDSDTASASGRSVSSKRSIGSLRAARAGAIGSERKHSFER